MEVYVAYLSTCTCIVCLCMGFVHRLHSICHVFVIVAFCLWHYSAV